MMPSPTRFLRSPGQNHKPDAAVPDASIDSDLIVILVSLLCAMICVVGLAFVARCARQRPSSSASGAPSSSVSARLLPAPAPADKGLKKKILRALPTISFEAAAGGVTECPICLAEFAEHDRIRVLPHCGHGFHVVCIDTWLGSRSSCPSCRRVLSVPAPGPSPAGVLDSHT